MTETTASAIGPAQRMEMTAREIAGNIHAHPTLSEVLMEAAEGIEGQYLQI